ncbi:MAG: hypothetical protein WBE18_07805 [Gammaproteobacteria bacterium]
MKKLWFFVVLLLLGGCATSPNTLGISDAEWKSYSKAQRNEILQNYRKIHKTHQEPTTQIASSTRGDNTNTISVNIQGGKIMMPPFTDAQDYRPVSFIIRNGHCKRVSVQANQGRAINLDACYQNKILYLDPSRYDISKSKGSLIFNAIPFWEHGFTYRDVSSSGYAQLTQVNITIQSIHE